MKKDETDELRPEYDFSQLAGGVQGKYANAFRGARLTFKKLIQDSQEYGSDDDHMVSRVFFDLETQGRTSKDLYVDLKQTVGSDIESDPIEVGPVRGHERLGNYEVFRREVEIFYRALIGSAGSGINIGGGAHVRMQNNTFE